jgi:hypothetical protein
MKGINLRTLIVSVGLLLSGAQSWGNCPLAIKASPNKIASKSKETEGIGLKPVLNPYFDRERSNRGPQNTNTLIFDRGYGLIFKSQNEGC